MLSMTEDDGVMDMSLQAEDAPTSHRTGDRGRDAGVAAQRRRRWTVEQKRQIVAESLEPGVSAAMVAHKHGITSGQFYAWRQQLVLAGALDTAAATLPSSASIDVPMTGRGGPLACPTAPACAVLGTPVAGLPAQADDPAGVVRSEAVAPAANGASRAADAASRDRCRVASSPDHAAADRGQVEPFGEPAPRGACDGALRGLRHGDGVRRAPVPGQQLLEFVLLGSAGDDAFQYVGEPGEWLDAIQLRRGDQGHRNGPVLGTTVAAGEQSVLAPM
jgi:transposase-like protein